MHASHSLPVLEPGALVGRVVVDGVPEIVEGVHVDRLELVCRVRGAKRHGSQGKRPHTCQEAARPRPPRAPAAASHLVTRGSTCRST